MMFAIEESKLALALATQRVVTPLGRWLEIVRVRHLGAAQWNHAEK